MQLSKLSRVRNEINSAISLYMAMRFGVSPKKALGSAKQNCLAALQVGNEQTTAEESGCLSSTTIPPSCSPSFDEDALLRRRPV